MAFRTSVPLQHRCVQSDPMCAALQKGSFRQVNRDTMHTKKGHFCHYEPHTAPFTYLPRSPHPSSITHYPRVTFDTSQQLHLSGNRLLSRWLRSSFIFIYPLNSEQKHTRNKKFKIWLFLLLSTCLSLYGNIYGNVSDCKSVLSWSTICCN